MRTLLILVNSKNYALQVQKYARSEFDSTPRQYIQVYYFRLYNNLKEKLTVVWFFDLLNFASWRRRTLLECVKWGAIFNTPGDVTAGWSEKL